MQLLRKLSPNSKLQIKYNLNFLLLKWWWSRKKIFFNKNILFYGNKLMPLKGCLITFESLIFFIKAEKSKIKILDSNFNIRVFFTFL